LTKIITHIHARTRARTHTNTKSCSLGKWNIRKYETGIQLCLLQHSVNIYIYKFRSNSIIIKLHIKYARNILAIKCNRWYITKACIDRVHRIL